MQWITSFDDQCHAETRERRLYGSPHRNRDLNAKFPSERVTYYIGHCFIAFKDFLKTRIYEQILFSARFKFFFLSKINTIKRGF